MSSELVGRCQGVGIYCLPLPSGDVAIQHAPNEAARAIVEPICRGRGYWHGEYNNWIVFRPFAEKVVADIALRCAQG